MNTTLRLSVRLRLGLALLGVGMAAGWSLVVVRERGRGGIGEAIIGEQVLPPASGGRGRDGRVMGLVRGEPAGQSESEGRAS
jgi:hypothetical protein